MALAAAHRRAEDEPRARTGAGHRGRTAKGGRWGGVLGKKRGEGGGTERRGMQCMRLLRSGQLVDWHWNAPTAALLSTRLYQCLKVRRACCFGEQSSAECMHATPVGRQTARQIVSGRTRHTSARLVPAPLVTGHDRGRPPPWRRGDRAPLADSSSCRCPPSPTSREYGPT